MKKLIKLLLFLVVCVLGIFAGTNLSLKKVLPAIISFCTIILGLLISFLKNKQ